MINSMAAFGSFNDGPSVHDRADLYEAKFKILEQAVKNLIDQKGRHNTEIAYKRLTEAYQAVTQ